MKILIAENLTILANFFGACAAYMLSNHMVRIGRFVGLAGASTWLIYGIILHKWDSVIAASIILIIYIQAIKKFQQKQKLYKSMIREGLADNLDLENKVEQLEDELIKLKVELEKSNKIRSRFHRMKKRKR